MSEARSLIARSSSASTHRTTGASSLTSIIPVVEAGVSPATISAAASLRSLLCRACRDISWLKSSAVTTSGRTVSPVELRMSSSATTSPGSVTATETVDSEIDTGSIRWRRASASGTRAIAAGSTGYPLSWTASTP